jgi:Bifunctional DNA primase/polymerase, N-terminal/Primase C terminal 2 (PriCT-2)
MANSTRTHRPSSPCLTAALHYATELGWTVFPAELPSKHPHKKAEFSNGNRWGATDDRKQIERDFRKWPSAAVCIPTGIGNGFFVIEADTLAGHGVDGITNLQNLIAGREWPDTARARSPSGSIHYYFAYPYAGRVRTRTGKNAIVPGVDLLGDGAMVVAPPSVKPDVGEYVWEKRGAIKHGPQWLLDLVIKEDIRRRSTTDDDIEINVDKVVAALDAATNCDLEENDWFRIIAAAYRGSAGHDEAYAAVERWSKKSSKHRDNRTKYRWEAFHAIPPTRVSPATLYWHADQTAPGWREAFVEQAFAVLRQEYAAAVAAASKKGARDA